MSDERENLIPEGRYRARAGKGEFGISPNGKDFCSVPFEIATGEFEGRRINAFLYFSTPENTRRSLDSLRYCGCTFPDNDLTNLTGIDKNEVEIEIAQELFEEKWRNKVKWINSGGAFIKDEQRMNAADKASFRERMKGAVVSAKSGNKTAAERAADQEQATPVDDSDIPF